MKIGVLIKQVPDTASQIKVKADGSGIEETGLKFVLNPYDEYAVEEAIKTKEKIGAAETYAISVGPDRVVESIRTALAMGIDKGIHISTGGQFVDSFMAATILAQVIQKQGLELVFCGKQAVDLDNAQTAQMTAEILDWPQVMIVEKFELGADKKSAAITRRMSGGAKEIYETPFPVLLGCEKGLNTPRYASLPGIMKAKSKPLEKLNAADLLAGAQSLVTLVNFQPPSERPSGKKLEGEPAQQVAQLVKLLREEAKAI